MEKDQEKTNGVAGPAEAVPAIIDAMSKPVPAPQPTGRIVGTMTSEENLRVENVAIRHDRLGLLKARLQDDSQRVADEEKKLNADMRELRATLAAKYNVDPNRMKLRTDGSIEESPA